MLHYFFLTENIKVILLKRSQIRFYVEFTCKQPSSNGKMSNYSVVELFVYQK